MFKTCNILILFSLLLSCVNNLNSFDSEKIIFTQGQKQTYSNGLKDESTKVRIEFESENEKMIVGDKGVLIFKTDFKDSSKFDLSTIEKDSSSKTVVTDYQEDEFNVLCKLWIRSDNKFSLFCNMDGQRFKDGEQSITINDYNFKHKDMIVMIIFPKKTFKIEQMNFAIPFLYSDIQTISINDETSYKLIFKIEVYNNDPLYIYGSNNNYAILDGCEKIDKELTCKISKENIEEFLVTNNEKFKLGSMNENYGVIIFDSILDITINYEITQKQDIYLEIKEIIGGKTGIGVPFGLVTNVTDIPNFISAKFDDMKYFKKISGRPLILFYNYSFEINYNMKSNYTKEVVISDIHYKYNFRIQPSKFGGYVSVREKGSNALLSYPKELIFNNKDDTFKIMIIMNEPDLEDSLMLVQYVPQETSGLKCKNLNKMKICSIRKSYFDKKQTGNYYIGHTLNSLNIFYGLSSIKVTVPIELNIVDVYKYRPIYIGNKGKLILRTYYNDTEPNAFNDSNIEEKTKFNISFSCGNKTYSDISCNLWKNIENVVFIFCQLNESLNNNDSYINIEGTKFTYNKLDIPIIQKKQVYFLQLDKSIPFLSSKNKTINLEEGINSYYLKFNVENYQNEKIIIRKEFLGTEIILDKCSLENKELTCSFDNSELEGNYFDNYIGMEFYIYYPYINSTGEPLIPITTIDRILIKYNSPKIDLKITIGKPIDKYIDELNFITHEIETNVTNISNLVSDEFRLKFEYADYTRIHECFFKKTNENPLYLLCNCLKNNISTFLSEIETEMTLNNIHYKYNFYIQPVNNSEKIYINGKGDTLFIIPKFLDFTSNDNIPIYLLYEGDAGTKGIRLNPNAKEDLECKDLDPQIRFKNDKESILRCIVPKSHFENQQNGYYNIYHLNHKNKYIQSYEISPIKVIFTNDDGKSDGGSSKPKNLVGIIVGSVVGGLVLIAAIVIIIIFVRKRKKNSNEFNNGKSGSNILPNSNQVELVEGDKFGNE